MNRKQFSSCSLRWWCWGAPGSRWSGRTSPITARAARRSARSCCHQLKIADVAEVRLQDAKHQVTLVRKEKTWVVQERGGYPASFQEISDLLIKLVELKVTQSEQVGASLCPRLDLAEPGKGGEGTGTAIEFKDAAGKPLARLVLGKKVLKKDPMNPLPSAKDGVPAGRYVRVDGAKDTIVVVSDPLEQGGSRPRPLAQPRISSRWTASGRSQSGRKAARRTGKSRATRNGASGNSRRAASASIRAPRSWR